MERPPDQPQVPVPPQPEDDGPDLLTVALVAFFVSLIGIVAALLLVPALF